MKALQYYNTLKYLKPIQTYYRLFYLAKNRVFKRRVSFEKKSAYSLSLEKSIYSYKSYLGKNHFKFLNLEHNFGDKIDWNYSKYGKLWTYNLNYFEYLNQKDFNRDVGVDLIYDYIKNLDSIKDGLEPFTISLRGLNWIKFLTTHNIKDNYIDSALYSQYKILSSNLEYHLLGNHLLENAFSLLFGAYYFQDLKFYNSAKKILIDELNEQILEDGAHFELSPMYHQLMLFRVLDCINLITHNGVKRDIEFEVFLKDRASLMLGYLEQITFDNGDIPLVNDSAINIAPTTNELSNYAKSLGVEATYKKLSSGYEMIRRDNYELFIDVCDLEADYIAGHTHSDLFNFLLNINGKEFIVDTGISTYEANSLRAYERSSKMHNTTTISNSNIDEVWGAFRVGDRAKVIKKEITDNSILAQHNGYKERFNTVVQREFQYFQDRVLITDTLSKNGIKAKFYLHFAQNIDLSLQEDVILTENGVKIKFLKYNNIRVKDGYLAKEFNKRVKTKYIEVEFEKELKVEIRL